MCNARKDWNYVYMGMRCGESIRGSAGCRRIWLFSLVPGLQWCGVKVKVAHDGLLSMGTHPSLIYDMHGAAAIPSPHVGACQNGGPPMTSVFFVVVVL